MTIAVKNVITSIPTMEEEDFSSLAQAVLHRLYQKESSFPALTEQDWARRLDHSLPQTNQKELRDARKRTAGKYRGQGWMADDFDAPLDDFKEYAP